MKFCKENYQDIKRYFLGSFVKFPYSGDILHYVETVNSDGIRGKRYAPSDTGVWEETPYLFHLQHEDQDTPEVEFVMPRKSYFNYNNAAHLLFRIPARQYHRGVTKENTAIAVLTGEDFDSMHLTFNTLNAYVGKQAFVNFARRDDWQSYAVSRRCAVSKTGRVFFDRVAVGRIYYDAKEICVTNELFIPELQKLVQEFSQDFVVKLFPAPEKKSKKKPSKVEDIAKELEGEF